MPTPTRRSRGQPAPEDQYDQPAPGRESLMEQRIRAAREGRLGEIEGASGVLAIPPYVLAFIGLVIVAAIGFALSGVFSGGSEQEVPQGNGAEVAGAQQDNVPPPPPPTQTPEPTSVPTPEGITLTTVGTDTALENKLSVDCGGQPLFFSLMLRKSNEGRLEVTLITNRPVPINALKAGENGTVLAPDTQCGVNVTWDGTTAKYTAVSP